MKDTTVKSIVAAAMVAVEMMAVAGTKHWRGTSSSLASVAGNWAEAEAPVAGDDIVLDADSANKPLAWDLDIALGSWMQNADYAGVVTFATGRAEDATTHGVTSADGKTKELRFTGNVRIDGGTWTIPEQPSLTNTVSAWKDGNGVYRLVARIGGTLTVAPDASIDVTGKGFLCYEGPGSGSHAGYAGYWLDHSDYNGTKTTARDCTYGSIKKPVTIGSGGDEYSGAGGGGIELEVAGAATVNGGLLADGIGTGHEDDSYSSGQPGAGGAVWLKAAALKGAGTISASHGYVMYTGGSGGRISVVLTGDGATFAGWWGEMRTTDAYADWDMGYYNYPTAGTIYLEEAGLNGVGDLIIKDGTTHDADCVYWENLEDGRLYFQTPMTPDAPEDTHFRDVSLLNGAILGLPSNAVLKVDRAFITDQREMDDWDELFFYQIDHVVFDGGEIDLPAEASIPNVTIHVQAPGSVLKAGDGTGTFTFVPNNRCKFDGGLVVDGNLTVAKDAKLDLGGGELTVKGDVAFNGTLLDAATSTLTLSGANVAAALNGARLGAVKVEAEKTVFTQGFDANSFEANAPECMEVAFAAGETFSFGLVNIDGRRYGEAFLALRSTIAGVPWTLEVGVHPNITGAIVSDSTARATGFPVVDRYPNVDEGGNSGWIFGGPNDPEGSDANPWAVGTAGHENDVVAWTNGTGHLIIVGIGPMGDFAAAADVPWHQAVVTVLTVTDGVTSIGRDAFNGCSGLKSVTIPASVESIASRAFLNCTSLIQATVLAENPPAGGEAMFKGTAEGFFILVPEGCGGKYRDAWGDYKDQIWEGEAPIVDVKFTAGAGVEKVEFRRAGAGEYVEFPSEGTNLVAGMVIELRVTPGTNYRYTGETQFTVPDTGLDETITATEIAWGGKERPWTAGETVLAHTNGTTLVIEGTGAMDDFASIEVVPWAEVADEVTAVTVADGVTRIGKNAWVGMADAVTINGTALSVIDFAAPGLTSGDPVIPDDKVLVSKEEIAAAKAETVTVDGGAVTLGVTVNTNGDFTAEMKSWQSVELRQENVKVENGKIVITIPVDSQSGFMILQSGDAKIAPAN